MHWKTHLLLMAVCWSTFFLKYISCKPQAIVKIPDTNAVNNEDSPFDNPFQVPATDYCPLPAPPSNGYYGIELDMCELDYVAMEGCLLKYGCKEGFEIFPESDDGTFTSECINGKWSIQDIICLPSDPDVGDSDEELPELTE